MNFISQSKVYATPVLHFGIGAPPRIVESEIGFRSVLVVDSVAGLYLFVESTAVKLTAATRPAGRDRQSAHPSAGCRILDSCSKRRIRS